MRARNNYREINLMYRYRFIQEHVRPKFLARISRYQCAISACFVPTSFVRVRGKSEMEELFSKALPVVFKHSDRDEK